MPGRRSFDSSSSNASPTQAQPGSIKQGLRALPARLQAPIFILTGAVMFKFCAWDVLDAARNHAPNVQISGEGIIISGVALIMGLYFLIFGDQGKILIQKNPGTGQVPALGWVVMLLLVGSGFLINYLVRAELIRLGYDVGYF